MSDATEHSGSEQLIAEGARVEPVEHILQFFNYAHLPTHLQEISISYHYQAQKLIKDIPRNPERTVALRKLLESKDAAVRAAMAK